MKILVTGFEAFHNHSENPSQEVVRLLPKTVKGHKIISLELPVLYDKSFDLVQECIEQEHPDIIIHLGLAQGRKFITPERFAINIDDVSIGDNDGLIRQGKTIKEDGENAYFSTLPLDEIVKRIQAKEIPVKISNHAGSYICNHVMYQSLHYIKKHNLEIQAGFIHLPLMDEQNEGKTMFSLPLHQLLDAVIDSIKACIRGVLI